MRDKNKKILLINPEPWSGWLYRKATSRLGYSFMGSPLGLLLIGSALKNAGYDVRIIDGAVEEDYLTLINNELNQRPFLVYISVMTLQVQFAVLLSDFIKKRDITIPIVWGGIHPCLYPEQTLSDKSVDILVIGRGERSVVEIANSIVNPDSLYSKESVLSRMGKFILPKRENLIQIWSHYLLLTMTF